MNPDVEMKTALTDGAGETPAQTDGAREPIQNENAHGPMLERISRRMVQLHKDYYGKGPTRTKTYYQDDVVTVLMRGGFTPAEETLFQSGRGSAVKDQRHEFQGAMEERFMDLITEETGRPVIAFMSTSHQHPDLVAEMFLLAPTEILDEDDRRNQ